MLRGQQAVYLLIVAAVALAACGSDEDAADVTDSAQTQVAATDPPATDPPATDPETTVPRLNVPQPGETQETVIGDITWTLLEGDESTQPPGVSAVIDGVFYGLETNGQGTWRSEDGIDWELTDLTPNGIIGVFEIDGETWARRSTLEGQGLGRWDGEQFAPVELPPSLSPDVDGLRSTPSFSSDPVQLGDQWVIPVTTQLGVPWNEFYPGSLSPEWDAVTETIRMVDWESNSPLPAAVLDVELVDGDPPAYEFRDAETGDWVTTVEVLPALDPDGFLQRVVFMGGVSFNEFLIGDGDGFEAVASPWPMANRVELVPLGGNVLAVAESYEPDSRGFGEQVFEMSISPDARSWEPLELPEAFGSQLDAVDIESDGSLALLTIVSSNGSSQRSETWSTADGRTWDAAEEGAGFGGTSYTELGWFRTDIYSDGGIKISGDGLVWQTVPFDIRPPPGAGGGGANVFGGTIFVSTWEDGGPRRMWVGKPADS